MSSILQEDQVFNNEVPFCTLYSMESKTKLEEIFLKHRVSYYVEWQEKTIWQRLFAGRAGRDKICCTFRINKADIERARELLKNVEGIKFRDFETEDAASVKMK